MKRVVLFVPVLMLVLTSLATAQNRTYTIDDLLKVRRVGDPQVSPDGRQVAFTIGDVKAVDERREFILRATLVSRREKDCLYDWKSGLDDGAGRR
jgi:hypothetical protein